MPRKLPAVGFSTGSSILWAEDEDVIRTIDTAADSGVESLRVDLVWTFAEPAQGQFDWTPLDRVVDHAKSRGLDILGTINNSPAWAADPNAMHHTGRPRTPELYGQFARAVAQHYDGVIDKFEIWNEPNGRLFFEPDPDPQYYTRMLKAAYVAIKSVQPDAVVVAGAFGPVNTGAGTIAPIDFLGTMYSSGAHGFFDALSYHPYDYDATLADGNVYPNSPMRQMVAMHQMMTANGDGGKKIWITEYGAPTTYIDDQQAADLIVGSLQQWQEISFAGAFYVYTVRDADSSSSHPEDRFGVVTDTYEPKAAMVSLTDYVAEGMPLRGITERFAERSDPDLGDAMSPVYRIGNGWGQDFQNGSRFSLDDQFTSSPPQVAAIARAVQLVPYGKFRDGMQRLDSEGGFVVFSRPDTGTHAVTGAIFKTWTPDMGFPVTDEYDVPGSDGRAVDFESGRIVYKHSTGDVSITRF